MRYRRTLAVAWLGRVSAGSVLVVALFGCALLPPNSFLDPTKVGQFPLEAREAGIRRILSPRETPPGIASATDPTPEDLVAVYEEYRIAPGDALGLAIHDLLESGRPFQTVVEVSPLGEIRIPDLGTVKVTGLTEAEVEQELKARLRESGLLPRPVVIASLQVKRGRLYHVIGAVRQAGPYAIGDPDLRLLEALGMAGDADANARRAYVIRREPGAHGELPAAAPPAPPVEEGLVIPPPMEEESVYPGSFVSAFGRGQQEPVATTQPPTRDELAEVLSPTPPQTSPAVRPAEEPPPRPFEPLIIFDPQTGALLPAELGPREAVEAEPARRPEELEEPFDWEEVEGVGLEQRVIAINLVELRNGNPRYNVVIRDRDVIHVPIDTGLFYLMGEVNRPGVYAFGGREITVKQAIAISGGFAPMAWPQRCELIRREPGTDKQFTRTVNLDAIFAGLEEDFFLRDEDILNVGTHTIAPFLFVVRNSFRFTYGFGFVYDRNFADKDAYGSKINPETLRIQQRASRGLPY